MKNRFIEFLRFILSIIVVMFHARSFYSCEIGPQISIAIHGYMAVEFFFILNGFFLAKKSENNITHLNTNHSIGNETLEVIIQRFKHIIPIQLYVFAICFILYCLINRDITFTFIIKSLPNLVFLDMTGISTLKIVDNEWYISAMFISIAILYPLLRKYYNYITKVLFPLLSLAIIGYLYNYGGGITGVYNVVGVVYKGVLRALAMIMIGCSTYQLSKKINEINLTKLGEIVFSVLEVLLYLVFAIYINCKLESILEPIIIILLALAIAISFTNKSFLSKIFTSYFWELLGKLSLPVYLAQSIGFIVAWYFYDPNRILGHKSLLLILIITLVTAISYLFIIKMFKKLRC